MRDPEGKFKFIGLLPGPYELTAEATSFAVASSDFPAPFLAGRVTLSTEFLIAIHGINDGNSRFSIRSDFPCAIPANCGSTTEIVHLI